MGVSTENVTPLLLDIPTACKYLGISTGTLRRWVTEGLPFVRAGAGGKKHFIPADLRAWIEKNRETVQDAA